MSATLDPMAKMGRPRTVTGSDEKERAKNTVVRLAARHEAELRRLMDEGKGANKSEAVRWLIEQSAEARAAKPQRRR